MRTYPLDASLTLAEAGPKWLEQHQRYIRPNTLRNYKACIKLLVANLGEVLVKDIHVGHIRAYQAARGKFAGPYLINSELSVLQMIMKECGEWERIKGFYKPMRVPKRRGGHSISADEERILREVAFSRPKWRLAAHCMMVMLSTTMGFGELRHIRRRDVDMKRRCLVVRDGAKNFYRDRTIPMNAAAYESMSWMLDRWEDLGRSKEDEFILPHRPRVPKGPWILNEAMGSITTAFNRIRKEAGLTTFRVYDCRVQAITKLLSNPAVSPQVSKEIAGHISQAMQDRYSIQQFDTKMAALEALETPSCAPVPPKPTAPASGLSRLEAEQTEEQKAEYREPGSKRQGAAAAWERIHAEAKAHYVEDDQSVTLERPSLEAPQTAIQAEIARQVDHKVALALQEYFASRPSSETQSRRRRTRKSASGGPRERSITAADPLRTWFLPRAQTGIKPEPPAGRQAIMLISAETKFSEAAFSWLDSRDTKSVRARYLKPRTLKTYRLEFEALMRFFGDTRLCDITNETIRKYQQRRSDGLPPFKHQRHPGHVNHEVGKLQKILIRANLWHLVAGSYEPLDTPLEEPRRVMTKREESHLFAVAASRIEFAFIYAYCLLSVSTSASGAELRGLRLIDVDLIGRTLQINADSAKNSVRVRTIPLVDDAVWAANSLVIRARQLGSVEPYHYLFAYRHGNRPYDPCRHMSDNGLQKRWNDLRKAAGMPWITGHVLRYQCITKMAEGGVDKITAMRVAGHVTDKMWSKYSQVRIDSTREKMMEAFKASNRAPGAQVVAFPSGPVRA